MKSRKTHGLCFCLCSFFVLTPVFAYSGDSISTATPIDLGVEYSGNIYESSMSPGRVEYYSFTIPSDGNVTAILRHENLVQSGGYSLDLLADDAAHTKIAGLNVEHDEHTYSLQEGLPAGTYYLSVYSLGVFPYDEYYYVRVQFSSSEYYEKYPNHTLSSATQINLNQEYAGNINATSVQRIDYYAFFWPAIGNAKIILSHDSATSNNRDGWNLDLLADDIAHTKIAELSMPEDEYAASLQEPLKSGIYYIKVYPLDSPPDEPYYLTVVPIPSGPILPTGIQVTDTSSNIATNVQAGDTVQFTVDTVVQGGATVHYQFFTRAGYGQPDWGGNPWTLVQDHSPLNSVTVTFDIPGVYFLATHVEYPGQKWEFGDPQTGIVVEVW